MVSWEVRMPRPGEVYRHYKGDLYRVLYVATQSNGCREGESVVVYEGLKHEPGTNVRVRSFSGKDGWDTWSEEIGPRKMVDGLIVYPERFTLTDQPTV